MIFLRGYCSKAHAASRRVGQRDGEGFFPHVHPTIGVDLFINGPKWDGITSAVLHYVYYFLYPKVAFKLNFPNVILNNSPLNKSGHTKN